MGLINEPRISWPGADPDRETLVYAAAIDREVWNMKTVLEVTVTGDLDFTVTPHADLRDGAQLTLVVNQDATGRDVTLGAAFIGDGITGVANDVDVIYAEYKKSAGKYQVVSVAKTVDAA